MSLRSHADLKLKRETWAAESSEDQWELRSLEVGDEKSQGGGQRVRELRAVPWGFPALKVLEGLRQSSLGRTRIYKKRRNDTGQEAGEGGQEGVAQRNPENAIRSR